MTVKILNFPLQLKLRHGNRSRAKAKANFPAPTPVKRASRFDEPRVIFNVEARGRKHGEIRRSLALNLTKDDVKNVLLRQILNEERAALKLTGVALYYVKLFQQLLFLESKCECPFCGCENDKSFLINKLQRDVEYVIRYAASSTPSKKKAKLFSSLKPHKSSSSRSLGCHFSYLGRSDTFNAALASWISDIELSNWANDEPNWVTEAEDMTEIRNGKRDALKLLKMQLLKSKKCGLCETVVNVEQQTGILCQIDQTLERLQ